MINMTKTRKEILKDLRTYFESADVNCGRWDVQEVSMILNRKTGAIEVKSILKPNIEYKSLNDLR